MFDRREIYEHFASCYPVETPSALAEILELTRQIVNHWKSGVRPIPWHRLKTLVDEQGVSWDWLLEGKEPKYRHHAKKTEGQSFDRHAINQRFLSLYPNVSQVKLGKILGINEKMVFKWRHDIAQVSWERLKHAVDTKGVTWDWLIEGR